MAAIFNKNNLLVASTTENILAKILLIATGSQVEVEDMNELFSIHGRDGGYGGIAFAVEDYMAKKLSANGGDLSKTVAQLMKNSTGDAATWTEVKATSFISDMAKIGVDTWTGLFTHLVESTNPEYGLKIDNNLKSHLQKYNISDSGQGTEATVLPPDISEKFVDPIGKEYYATIGIHDQNNNLIKEFQFDAPKMLFTATANIFDFGGGDKTLAVTSSKYDFLLGLGKDSFFINFSAGDKVVIIDDSKYSGFGEMNKNDATFYNTIQSFQDYTSPYDPDLGIWKMGDSLINISTPMQPNGSLLSFPQKGLPAELASLSENTQYLQGITYDLNLKGSDNFLDGQIIIVGKTPTLLGHDNFSFNDPIYSI